MNHEASIAKASSERTDSEHHKREMRRMTIASFAVPEKLHSSRLDQARKRLGAAGVSSYTVELAGAGEPLLDLAGTTYVGEDEIQSGVDHFIDELG